MDGFTACPASLPQQFRARLRSTLKKSPPIKKAQLAPGFIRTTTIKGEINETKPTILSAIYLQPIRLRCSHLVPKKLKKFYIRCVRARGSSPIFAFLFSNLLIKKGN